MPQKQFTLEQAVQAAPLLASLQNRIRQSQHCMDLIRHLLPEPLRCQVRAGPFDDNGWCLLVTNASTSTKLRQLLPVLLETLDQNGQQVSSIRIKVQAQPR